MGKSSLASMVLRVPPALLEALLYVRSIGLDDDLVCIECTEIVKPLNMSLLTHFLVVQLVETFAREEVDSLDVVTTLHLEAHRAMGSTVEHLKGQTCDNKILLPSSQSTLSQTTSSTP
ncbi:hypothetical protein BJ742DRAFT_813139 [Cladochytrium replicatum]|nr:hypothetical protein BJ742DRAFT_813139 [Cladochytrium replicatum]